MCVVLGISGNFTKNDVHEIIKKTLDFLFAKDVNFIVDSEYKYDVNGNGTKASLLEIGKKSDIVLSFGGDGSLLHISKVMSEFGTPVLGVNMGHLGFLAEVDPSEIEKRLVEIFENKYSIETRSVLQVEKLNEPNTKKLAVNDVVMDKGSHSRILKISMRIGDKFSNVYSANGIIVSTATGSTGYSLSAGGPIVYPSIDNILITPICPHTLSIRPMIIPGTENIEIELITDPGELHIQTDGNSEYKLYKGEKLLIRKSTRTVKLVHFNDSSFYQVLSDKMGWGLRNEKK